MAKICCGGFYLGEGLELDGRTLKATGGSGLPDPSTLSDGTAMVAVNGEWKMQEGYGYIEQGEQTVITWDGDTEGKISVADTYYKVSDNVINTKEDAYGCILALIGDEEHPRPFVVGDSDIVDNVIPHAIMISDYAISVIEPTSYSSYVFPEAGIYFSRLGDIYTSSLTYGTPDTAHKFDPALIPASGDEFVVKFTSDTETVEVDKTVEEIVAAFSNGKNISCYLCMAGIMVLNSNYIKVSDGEVSVQFIRVTGAGLMVVDIGHDGSSWAKLVTNYTLTPAD